MSVTVSSFDEFLSTDRRLTATMCLLSLTVHMWAAIWKNMHSSPISYCLSAHPPVPLHLCNGGGGGGSEQNYVLHSLKSWRNDPVERVNSELIASYRFLNGAFAPLCSHNHSLTLTLRLNSLHLGCKLWHLTGCMGKCMRTSPKTVPRLGCVSGGDKAMLAVKLWTLGCSVTAYFN